MLVCPKSLYTSVFPGVCVFVEYQSEWLLCDKQRGRVQCDSFQGLRPLFLVVCVWCRNFKACLDDVSLLEQWRRLAWCGRGTVEFARFITFAKKFHCYTIGWIFFVCMETISYIYSFNLNINYVLFFLFPLQVACFIFIQIICAVKIGTRWGLGIKPVPQAPPLL